MLKYKRGFFRKYFKNRFLWKTLFFSFLFGAILLCVDNLQYHRISTRRSLQAQEGTLPKHLEIEDPDNSCQLGFDEFREPKYPLDGSKNFSAEFPFIEPNWIPFEQKDNLIQDKYTIVCNSYKRNDLLVDSIRHYRSCPRLHSYHVAWSDQENEPPYDIASAFAQKNMEVVFHKFEKNSLNNRFLPPLGNEIETDYLLDQYDIKTEAILSIDDDVLIPCDQLEKMFDIWKENRERMVGPFPRALTCNPATLFEANSIHYVVDNFLQTVSEYGYYIILTKYSFFHRDMLKFWWMEVPETILNHVDKNMNCEDIAFSFVAAEITGKPGIWTKSSYFDAHPKSGISKGKSHANKRDTCLKLFREVFGGVPLIHSTQMVDLETL